jgi:hypothetical protein
MNVKDKTGPMEWVEFHNPLTGNVEVFAVRFETIEMTAEQRAAVKIPALSNAADPRLLILRNYILAMCAQTPHVVPDQATIETDSQDEGQQLGS